MNGDEYAEQIAQMSKTMFAYCLSRTNSYHDAEDLAQEILLISCKNGNSFPSEKAFYSFVWRTADNILKSWYRNKSKQNCAELEDSISDASWERLEEQAQENEQLTLITRELALLNSNHRRVMVAYYIDGFSVKEISARFSLSQSMVKYLLFQSRKRIKEGITMERNFGEYSYNPVHLDWRWLNSKAKDYRGVLPLTSIQQNIIMACYYDKLNEEQLSMLLGVPTAYLEDEIQNLVDYELLVEKNGFYLANMTIQTKSALSECFKAKENMLKETAEKIKTFFAENEEKVRSVGFYGSDMSVNSLKWLVVSRLLCFGYFVKLDDELSKNFPDPKNGTFAQIHLIEQEEAPKGNNYDPLMMCQETEHGTLVCNWIRFNTSVFHRLSDVQVNILTQLPKKQPQTDTEKMICTELMEMGCAVKAGDEIKPNYPCLTEKQNGEFCYLLMPFVEELFHEALDRVELTKKITLEHTPERFQPYVKDMIIMPMYVEVSDITRMLVEENWLVQWTGMNPTNLIITK